MRILGDLEPRQAKESGRGNIGDVPIGDSGGHVGGAPVFRQIGESRRSGDRRSAAGPAEWTRNSGSRRHSTGALWCAFVLLVLVLIGESAYGYRALHGGSIAQIPDLLQSVTKLTGGVTALEARLPGLEAQWNGLADRMVRLDRKVDATLRATRHQTQELVAQAEGRLRDQMDRQAQAVEARLSQVESNQREDHTRLARLNDQLEKEVASLRGELAASQDGTNRGLASLHQEVGQNAEGLHALTQQLHRERVSFETAMNTPTEIVPGVSLTVLKTNVSYQRIRGYVSLTADGRTLWLDDLGAQEALNLYPSDINHPYSLVITRVNANGVAGYLLLPAGAQRG
jgi:hypothetical protein